MLTRSRALARVKSRSPFKVTPFRKFAALLIARKAPPPVVLMTPDKATPFCNTVLPVPALIELPIAPVTLLLSTKVPPLVARKMPLLVTADSMRVMVPPDTSAAMMPLLTRV